jgi:hypothetical protein
MDAEALAMTTPRIIRVFPRKTKATPIDALAYFGPPDRIARPTRCMSP